MSPAAMALFVAFAILLPIPSQLAAAQSTTMYINAVDLDIVPTERDKFLVAIKENGIASVKEPGCRQYDILVLASNPNHIFLYEVYASEAAFKAHAATDHFKKYLATTAKIVVKAEVKAMSPIALNSKGH
jgi:quinol monooxygenase YgiN